MAKPSRKAATLSISLPPELAKEVANRVEGGLYTSASEVVREALRLLLHHDAQKEAQKAHERADALGSEITSRRFAEASRLMDLGLSLGQERAAELAREQEGGPGLRRSPERLSKLELDGPGR